MNTKTDSREKILKTAARLFQLKGYNATGLNEILKESGAPKGSLYYYFPNGKEELALESIKLASESIQAKIRTTLGKYSNPIESIQCIIKNMIEDMNEEGKFQDFSISLLALETYLSSEPLREACKQAFTLLENLYAEKLIEGGVNKEKAKELSIVINLMVEGAITVSVTKKDVTALLCISKHIGILLTPYF
jgi:TetR/AcrR family transcriptional repressor of lmrAB and yxaGH operons